MSATRMVTKQDRELFRTKSNIVKKWAKENNIPVVDVKCPVVEIYREDYLGFPCCGGDCGECD